MSSIVVFSPAKINLFLFIRNKRRDGFHNIESLMIPLKSVGDTLNFHTLSKKKISIKLSLSKKIRQKSFKSLIPTSKKNLVWKAASLFYKNTGLKPSLAIHIKKEIPLGAGLGGGSSNAAITLQTLNHLHAYPLSQKKLLTLSSQLGSDVPFFLSHAPAIIWGKGDKIKAVNFHPKGWILLLNPGFAIPTPWAYQKWDFRPSSETPAFRPSLTKNVENVKNYSFFSKEKNWKNDFEKVIFPFFPLLEEAKKRLIETGAKVANLSGSGPSLYGIFNTLKAAQSAAKKFDKKTWESWITQI